MFVKRSSHRPRPQHLSGVIHGCSVVVEFAHFSVVDRFTLWCQSGTSSLLTEASRSLTFYGTGRRSVASAVWISTASGPTPSLPWPPYDFVNYSFSPPSPAHNRY
ncbi:hypothetical protein K438DRAFT_979786 [Mycena galopus ATCC 62051]|nr:hypothetical protein K438DRAFT_979786 [Mycena galopus ATCC 62051]